MDKEYFGRDSYSYKFRLSVIFIVNFHTFNWKYFNTFINFRKFKLSRFFCISLCRNPVKLSLSSLLVPWARTREIHGTIESKFPGQQMNDYTFVAASGEVGLFDCGQRERYGG